MSVIPIAVVVGLAWIVAKYVEPIVHNFLKSGKDRNRQFFLDALCFRWSSFSRRDGAA